MNGFRVGNLFTGAEWGQSTFDAETGEYISVKIDEDVLKELERMFGDETGYSERRVTVTLKDISLAYSEQFGAGRCTASIAAVEEI
ncbi:MAG: hypothetical protein NC084_04935 [Bacteroides sp.]|nr:hypothetical protein [Eubacterium sp.]MCM1418445.1 hypothetical protein [Roseburia sp.]MCM1462041.1 hypothetical protein [Bacteroides sp.]